MASPVKSTKCEESQFTHSDSYQPICQNEKNTLLDKTKKKQPYSSEGIGDEPIDYSSSTNKSSKYWEFLLSLTIEPFMFIFFFSFIARSVCVTNLIMEKVCRWKLNHTEEICANLSGSIKEDVERITNDLGMYNTLIQMGPGAIVMMFLGPWSDKYGRKPPLLIASTGVLLDALLVIINTIHKEFPAEYMLLCSIPSGLTGGFVGTVTMIYSLASETTTKRARTMKYAIVELSFGLGLSLGTLAGGLLYNTKYSYYAAFGVSALGQAVCIPWILFVIGETRGLDVKASWLYKLKDLFTCENLVEGFKACARKRDNHGRCQIWLLLISMCAIIVTYEAFAGIGYIYTFHIYGWTVTKYSEVNTIITLSSLVLSVICVPLFLRIFKTGDAGLAFIGSFSMFAKNILFAFSKNHTWIYYTGGIVGAVSGLSMFAIRARLSKLVDVNEVVKVFTFLSACESLIPLVGKVAITKIYNASIDFFPGLAYLSGALLLLIPLGTFGWISRLKNDGYSLMQNPRIQEP